MKIEVNKVKIIVTVPSDNTDEICKVICEAGAGIIGNYNYCTTIAKSIGTFIPSEYANPYLGEKNKLKFVEEDKLEVICDIKIAKKVIIDLRKAHPYEEPAIDIIPLIDEEKLK